MFFRLFSLFFFSSRGIGRYSICETGATPDPEPREKKMDKATARRILDADNNLLKLRAHWLATLVGPDREHRVALDAALDRAFPEATRAVEEARAVLLRK